MIESKRRKYNGSLIEFIITNFFVLFVFVLLFTGESVFFVSIRTVLGLIYVLFLPGHYLTRALFPFKGDIKLIENIGLSLGLSVAVTPFVGLFLNVLSIKMNLWSVFFAEYAVILIFGVFGILRQYRNPDREPFVLFSIEHRLSLPLNGRLNFVVYLIMSITLIFVIFINFWILGLSTPDEYFSEFFLISDDMTVTPSRIQLGETLDYEVGVVNRERGERIYWIEVWLHKDVGIGEKEILYQGAPFRVGIGEEVEESFSIVLPYSGEDQQVLIDLYMNDKGDQPYRELVLWLDVME